MSKPLFAFAMNAIVTMPRLNGTRGKITSRTEHAESQTEYFIEALPGSQRAPKEWHTESDLLAAQPAEIVTPVAAVARSLRKRRSR